MAVRYAVANGNWSSTSTWNGGTLPTSADDVYSNTFTVTIDQNINVLSLRNSTQSPAVQGGGFVVSGDYTITAGNILKGNSGSNCLTYTGSGTLNINGNIIGQLDQSGLNINITGNGNVNMVGTISDVNGNSGRYIFNKAGTGKLTFTGNITANLIQNSYVLYIANGSFEMTGNVTYGGNPSGMNNSFPYDVIAIASAASANITGSLINTSANAGSGGGGGGNTSCVSNSGYFKHIGTMNNQSYGGCCLKSIYPTAINLCTGPFISSPIGMTPFVAWRMHYQITALSYLELRDSSTNGALPPAASAPATRLVSPDTVVDAPIPANVRNGVTYALGSQTGTLKVPLPSQVSKGIQTDNTVGTAALTPEDVWNALTSTMNTPGSIGNRLKNTSTVETTGDQIASLL